MADPLSALRAQIQAIEGRPAVPLQLRPTGLDALDAAVGGLPQPGVVEVVGMPGSGRTRLVLGLVAATTTSGQAAWVDGGSVFYPPTAAALGADLRRLVLLRPPADRAVWAVEQVLRSGGFPLVVVDGVGEPGVARWAQAARLGMSTLIVIGERPNGELPVCLRLGVVREQVSVQRHRGGRVGATFPVPAWPEGMDPWAR